MLCMQRSPYALAKQWAGPAPGCAVQHVLLQDLRMPCIPWYACLCRVCTGEQARHAKAGVHRVVQVRAHVCVCVCVCVCVRVCTCVHVHMCIQLT